MRYRKKDTLILNIYKLKWVRAQVHVVQAKEGGGAQDHSFRWCLHVPQEAETLVQKLLAGPEVEQLFWQRGNPAVCVEDAFTDLHVLERHTGYIITETDDNLRLDLLTIINAALLDYPDK